MKFTILKGITILFLAVLLFSCDSMPVSITETASWRMTDESTPAGTIKLTNVTVDRTGNRDSLEKEVTALAPLYFWTEGFKTVEPDGSADYAVQINLREREIASGWRTRTSLAVEVRIWDCADKNMRPDELAGKLPVAASRAVLSGNKSFSSSKTTEKMLSKAISKTLKQLPPAPPGTNFQQQGISLLQR